MSDEKTVFVGEPQPQGVVRIPRPPLFWRIWPNVSQATVHLDDIPIPSRYDPARRAVVAQPPVALRPGPHRVRCSVTLRGGGTASKDWSFTVVRSEIAIAGGASTSLGALSPVNRLRATLRLPQLREERPLQIAALVHARYLRRNRAGGHLQEASRPGFVGQNPADRARAFGFVEDALVEDVAVQKSVGMPVSGDIAGAVTSLFAAPYHRLPFLNPILTRFGAARDVEAARGRLDSYVVLLFGGSDDPGRAPQTVVSPFDGEREVPTAWTSYETPDPLRLHENRPAQVGFPIVFAHYPTRPPGRAPAPLRFDGASLTGPDGQTIPILINEPRTDRELGGQAVLLIPRQPLLPGQTYTVKVSARDGDSGKNLARTWRFTTRSR
jgi:uncharacterized protein YkwD